MGKSRLQQEVDKKAPIIHKAGLKRAYLAICWLLKYCGVDLDLISSQDGDEHANAILQSVIGAFGGDIIVTGELEDKSGKVYFGIKLDINPDVKQAVTSGLAPFDIKPDIKDCDVDKFKKVISLIEASRICLTY